MVRTEGRFPRMPNSTSSSKPRPPRVIHESKPAPGLSPISEAIADIAAGKMVILVDDEDRENEGDLCMAADKVTPEAINFMAKYGRGLICLSARRRAARQAPSRDDGARLRELDALRHRLHGLDRSARRRDHRHLRRRPRAHDPGRRRRGREADGHRSPRPRLPAARAQGRRAAPGRSDGRLRRSRAPRRLPTGWRHLRDHERRRHDGAACPI